MYREFELELDLGMYDAVRLLFGTLLDSGDAARLSARRATEMALVVVNEPQLIGGDALIPVAFGEQPYINWPLGLFGLMP